MAQLDRTLPNPALALARKRLLEVNRVLLNHPSPKTRPTWERLRRALLRQIAGLEDAGK